MLETSLTAVCACAAPAPSSRTKAAASAQAAARHAPGARERWRGRKVEAGGGGRCASPAGRRPRGGWGLRLSALGSRLSALGSRLSALGSRLSALGSRLSALGSQATLRRLSQKSRPPPRSPPGGCAVASPFPPSCCRSSRNHLRAASPVPVWLSGSKSPCRGLSDLQQAGGTMTQAPLAAPSAVQAGQHYTENHAAQSPEIKAYIPLYEGVTCRKTTGHGEDSRSRPDGKCPGREGKWGKWALRQAGRQGVSFRTGRSGQGRHAPGPPGRAGPASCRCP